MLHYLQWSFFNHRILIFDHMCLNAFRLCFVSVQLILLRIDRTFLIFRKCYSVTLLHHNKYVAGMGEKYAVTKKLGLFCAYSRATCYVGKKLGATKLSLQLYYFMATDIVAYKVNSFFVVVNTCGFPNGIRSLLQVCLGSWIIPSKNKKIIIQ